MSQAFIRLRGCAVQHNTAHAFTYLLMHGIASVCLGNLWARQVRFSISFSIGVAAKTLGLLGYITLTSWMLNDNMFSLLMQNAYSALVRVFGFCRFAKMCCKRDQG